MKKQPLLLPRELSLPRRRKRFPPVPVQSPAPWRRTRVLRFVGSLLVVCLVLWLPGCSTLGYYTQALVGGGKVLLGRQQILRVLARDDLQPRRRAALELVLEAREFARTALDLPESKSFQSVVEIDGAAAVWNVVAAPRYSVQPKVWCFPVAGCVTYRGYFSRRRAERFAHKLERRGFETTVDGAAAYSTLGWFADPVFSTVLSYPDWQLAGLIFHELAHERLYVPGDTAFNESMATFVELEGVERWLARPDASDSSGLRASVALYHEREDLFHDLLLRYRARLAGLYADTGAVNEAAKKEIFVQLRGEYEAISADWRDGPRFDGWFSKEPNNARLAQIADYAVWVPAFRRLFAESNGFADFFGRAEELSKIDPVARRVRLNEMLVP